MFLRSAKNAGFEVPEKAIDDAVAYVERCFRDDIKAFNMEAKSTDHRSRGMAAAGVLAMAHAGKHRSEKAQKSGKLIFWLQLVGKLDDGL